MLKCCEQWLVAIVLGFLIAAFPIRFDNSGKIGLTVGFPFAYAKGGGDGGGDNSGHGNGGDDGNDNSGHGNSNDDGDDDNNSGHGNRRDDGRISSENNVEIRYTNGWQERIRDGRYRLTDPKGRTVKERWARPDDLTRMRQLLSQ